jgi:hypothetical protein
LPLHCTHDAAGIMASTCFTETGYDFRTPTAAVQIVASMPHRTRTLDESRSAEEFPETP